MKWRASIAVLVAIQWAATARGDIDVNDPLPITHRVTVQIIQTALDNGTSPATLFGTPAQRADIEAGIDTIWAQAGIDIAFLPNVVHYNDTFAYQGNAGDEKRPNGDLNNIIDSAEVVGGILHSNPYVLNMFFVEVSPGFTPLDDNTTAGIARIADDGMAVFVGDALLTFGNGRDAIAGLVAHEIGHNLGLNHTATGGPNLMSPSGTTEQLTSAQVNTVFSATNVPQLLSTVLAGDYNTDGTVDDEDYTIWRDTLGQMGAGLAADGNNSGRIDAGDYDVWKSNYGETDGVSAGSAISAAPESPSIVFAFVALAIISASRRPCRLLRAAAGLTISQFAL